jgi:hypothetical protein
MQKAVNLQPTYILFARTRARVCENINEQIRRAGDFFSRRSLLSKRGFNTQFRPLSQCVQICWMAGGGKFCVCARAGIFCPFSTLQLVHALIDGLMDDSAACSPAAEWHNRDLFIYYAPPYSGESKVLVYFAPATCIQTALHPVQKSTIDGKSARRTPSLAEKRKMVKLFKFVWHPNYPGGM